MARDIGEWLNALGLGKYAAVFAENEIDLAAVAHVTDDDLQAIGVALGARRKLLAAAATLALPSATTGQARPVTTGASEAERRYLTVGFVDLVGSTALAERLDPEDLREVITSYQETVAEAVTRYGGHVAKFMGDGVLAYFGWPRAQENDAERAVRAALAVIEALSGRKLPEDHDLVARIGIATGLVVVGDLIGEGAAQEQAAIGETPNLAARLQGEARPGQVLVCAATRKLLGDLFTTESLAPRKLKGICEPVAAFVVTGERALESRFAARSAQGILPLIGRDEELALILERWRQAKDGEGQMVLLSGEAGIGKSRITRATADAISEEPHQRITYQCSPFHTDSALYPVIQQLAQGAKFASEDSQEARLDKLETYLAQSESQLGDNVPLLARLLGLETDRRYGALALSSEQQRARTLNALITLVLDLAVRQPVVLIVEDAHWVDPTTLELMEGTLERIAACRVLMLVTARPAFQQGFLRHSIVTRLALNRLGRREVRGIVLRLSGDRVLPAEVIDEIIAKTDGIPLFVEELTKTVLESGLLRDGDEGYVFDGPLQDLAIPGTLKDSLMARLDRHQAIKEVAQTASCIGRVFDFCLLAAISDIPDEALRSALDRLVAAELIFRNGEPADAAYSFKHALVQDAAHDSLLRTKRQGIHKRIAEALGKLVPGIEESQPELLARHHTEAGETQKAINYWLRAGRLAMGRSADKEALGHLGRGLAVLESLPETMERARQELSYQLALSTTLMTTKGWGAAETARSYARARKLCEKLGDDAQLMPVLYGEYMHHIACASYQNALTTADDLITLGEKKTNVAAIMQGHRLFAWSSTYLGNLRVVEDHIDQVIDLYDHDEHRSIALHYAHDVRVAAYCIRAVHQSLCGYPDRARAASDQAIACARKLGQASSIAYGLLYAGALSAVIRHDVERAADCADELLTLSSEQGYAIWLPYGHMIAGWAKGRMGRYEEGAAEFRSGLDDMLVKVANPFRPFFLCLLAELYILNGQTRDALPFLDEARALIDRTGERHYEAEVERLMGEARQVLDAKDRSISQQHFEKALKIARSQQAKLLELRAAVSLARLWHRHGESVRARQTLAPVFSWFSEGFNSPDLTACKALLDALKAA